MRIDEANSCELSRLGLKRRLSFDEFTGEADATIGLAWADQASTPKLATSCGHGYSLQCASRCTRQRLGEQPALSVVDATSALLASCSAISAPRPHPCSDSPPPPGEDVVQYTHAYAAGSPAHCQGDVDMPGGASPALSCHQLGGKQLKAPRMGLHPNSSTCTPRASCVPPPSPFAHPQEVPSEVEAAALTAAAITPTADRLQQVAGAMEQPYTPR